MRRLRQGNYACNQEWEPDPKGFWKPSAIRIYVWVGVPALLVQTPFEVVDVFPHKESDRIVTINDFVSQLRGA
jgi:hypothetical protein